MDETAIMWNSLLFVGSLMTECPESRSRACRVSTALPISRHIASRRVDGWRWPRHGCGDSDTGAHAPGHRRVGWVDHLVLSEQWPQPGSERLRPSQECQVPREVEPAVLEGGLKTGHELAAKNAPGHREGKKEPA